MAKQLKILVADDTEPNLILISKFVSKLGHSAIPARSGREAIEKFQSESPDLILMDIMMPEIDGYQATARIRELCGTKWVPVIFVSAKTHDYEQAKALEMGGDDYLTKPINLTILEAKIKAMQRIAEMQSQIVENTEQLERYRDDNEREHKLAQHLIEKITRYTEVDKKHIKRWHKPAQHFSGDIIIAAHTPADDLHVLLADGTGHGLSAALSVMPVVEAFYGMTAKGFSISSIAHELNRKLKHLMPTERFVAATLASISLANKTIQVWNGGNPPAIFVSDSGKLLRTWKSSHPALGIFTEADFDSTTEAFRWQEPGQLYLCSDGLVEIQNEAGEEFGQERMLRVLVTSPGDSRVERLISAVTGHLGGLVSHDDISLAAINCPMELGSAYPASKTSQKKDAPPVEPHRWKLALRLSAVELKSIDIVPLLLAWIGQLDFKETHRNQVYLIFTELFNNALDHGILKLDSTLKSRPDGFEKYIEERRLRLATLEHGILEIEAERLRQEGTEFLRVHIKDSGNGFDHESVMKHDIASSTLPSGRGIALVKHLCRKIDYLGNGNEVAVLYELDGISTD
ncbi:MAG: SpoIIE family protein phosphatase [Pseudomonadota bacterium]